MADKPLDKPLVIDVDSNYLPSGPLNKWESLNNTNEFIKNIVTPQLEKGTNIAQLVSGIPSAFARVNLFRTALDYSNGSASLNEANTLLTLYADLVNEWRGLIACIALDNALMEVKRIDLVYSDNKTIELTENVYEPKGAFGNMLLERKTLWCEQKLNNNDVQIPYINVIKYRGMVVGATAPDSLLFTSTGYKLEPNKEHPWISNKGRFIDPINSAMSPMQVAELYAYIGHLIEQSGEFQAYYRGANPEFNINSIRTELEHWQSELAEKASKEGVDLELGSVPPVSAKFEGPFKDLFCYKDVLWGKEGEIYTEYQDGSVEFDPKDLLLDETVAKIARIELNVKPEDFEKLPILVLTADVRGHNKKAYFALPLSALGLNVYGKTVGNLVNMPGYPSHNSSELKAVFIEGSRANNLEVSLNIKTNNGKMRSFKKVYTSDGTISNKDILLWPNFVSNQWNQYYMYSELPHNGNTQNYKAVPLAGELYQDGSFNIMLDETARPILLSENGKITPLAKDESKGICADLLVVSSDAVADNPYKYEIYKSKKPFKGVKLLSPTSSEGGYILVNYTDDRSKPLPLILNTINQLKPVTLGIDFGSTNTSIAISDGQTEYPNREKQFKFTNQRVSLMGREMPGSLILPRENHILFFQGACGDVDWNSIKSTLTIHDPRRLSASNEVLNLRISQAVVGGFPCFSDELPLTGSNERNIYLNFPNSIGQVTQIHNMKWEEDENSIAYKKAFLKGLLLHVYAALFANQEGGYTFILVS
jgi:hypothetical protein